jgi:hypothetical protein
MATYDVEAYDPSREPGGEQDERAARHRKAALEAADGLDPLGTAVVNALLAIESRIEELTCFVARLG